jgi:Tol biopolymer transport system component
MQPVVFVFVTNQKTHEPWDEEFLQSKQVIDNRTLNPALRTINYSGSQITRKVTITIDKANNVTSKTTMPSTLIQE